MEQRLLETISPGEILYEHYMKPRGLNADQLACEIQVSPARISAIINGKRAITPDTAIRIGRYFGSAPEAWLNLQLDYSITKCGLASESASMAKAA